MCSISGFIVISPSTYPIQLAKAYGEILLRGQDRGHDSAGIVTISQAGCVQRLVNLGPPNLSTLMEAIDPSTQLCIGNNRAEPTTEFVADKSTDDIQPFGNGNIYVSHNGIIANDHLLSIEYGIGRKTKIDTGIIPDLLNQIGIQNGLKKLIGSFALAIVDKRDPNRLWLARNFKPLFLQKRPDLGAIFFASRPEHLLPPNNSILTRLEQPPVIEVPPYCMVEINAKTGEISQQVLYGRALNRRALVICSGGLDSTTAAKWTQMQGYETTLLHFKYGCRAQEREIQAIQKVAQYMECDYRIEDLNWLAQLGGSSLTDLTMKITENETGAEFPHEWVPARNLIFASLAAGLCDRFGYDTLVMGLNLEEGGAYPDNTVEFYELLDRVFDIGTMSRPRILSPLGKMVKHEIVRLALEIEAPVHLSWSCYHGGEQHCGNCGPCFMRRNAFRMVGVPDNMTYEA